MNTKNINMDEKPRVTMENKTGANISFFNPKVIYIKL